MSTQIVAVFALILAELLPRIGVTIGSDELTSTLQTIVAVASGLWIWYQRVANLRRTASGNSDVGLSGARK